jgi:hypothetical protein
MAKDPNQEFIDKIMQAESNNRRYDANGKLLQGPKTKHGTAKGEMQVLDKTFVDPGYGVEPARNKSPEERARVGKDYAAAMLQKYDNNQPLAAAAYNWGPGNVDKWVAGGMKGAIPGETAKYVEKVTGSKLGTQMAQKPATSPMDQAAPAPRPVAGAARMAQAEQPAQAPQDKAAMLAALGPNYQAAMALSFLVDNSDEDDPTVQAYKERTEPSVASQWLAQVKPPALASVDLSVRSPFPEEQAPLTMAKGGEVKMPPGGPVHAALGQMMDSQMMGGDEFGGGWTAGGGGGYDYGGGGYDYSAPADVGGTTVVDNGYTYGNPDTAANYQGLGVGTSANASDLQAFLDQIPVVGNAAGTGSSAANDLSTLGDIPVGDSTVLGNDNNTVLGNDNNTVLGNDTTTVDPNAAVGVYGPGTSLSDILNNPDVDLNTALETLLTTDYTNTNNNANATDLGTVTVTGQTAAWTSPWSVVNLDNPNVGTTHVDAVLDPVTITATKETTTTTTFNWTTPYAPPLPPVDLTEYTTTTTTTSTTTTAAVLEPVVIRATTTTTTFNWTTPYVPPLPPVDLTEYTTTTTTKAATTTTTTTTTTKAVTTTTTTPVWTPPLTTTTTLPWTTMLTTTLPWTTMSPTTTAVPTTTLMPTTTVRPTTTPLVTVSAPVQLNVPYQTPGPRVDPFAYASGNASTPFYSGFGANSQMVSNLMPAPQSANPFAVTPVSRAGGSPASGESTDYFQDPMGVADSGPITSDTMAKGKDFNPSEAAKMLKGVAKGTARNVENIGKGALDAPYDLAGAPVDLISMAMRPAGYKEQKPVMGSDWIKEQATKYGIRPEDSKDPQDQGFRMMGEAGAGLLNPASVVRGAMRTGATAADMLKNAYNGLKTAQVAAKAAPTSENLAAVARMNEDIARQRQAVREMNARLDTIGIHRPSAAAQVAPEVAPVAAPHPAGWGEVALAPEGHQAIDDFIPAPAEAAAMEQATQGTPALPEVAPVAAPGEISVPADRPFVGRLDQLVDQLPGPVQKQQLINQVKKNLREYDVQRLETALADIPANAKLTPEQLKEALGKTYSPQRFKSEDLPVDTTGSKFWESQDNVFGKQLGTTNLYLDMPPEVVASSKDAKSTISAIKYFANFTTDIDGSMRVDADKLKALIGSSPLLKDLPASKSLLNKVNAYTDDINEISQKTKEISDAARGFLFPVIYTDAKNDRPYWKIYNALDKSMEESAVPKAERELLAHQAATRAIGQEAINRLKAVGVDPAKLPDLEAVVTSKLEGIPAHELFRAQPEFKQQLNDALDPILQKYNDLKVGIQRDITPEVRKLEASLEEVAPYAGQHGTIAGQAHPIGFSRYSEHEAAIPGMGDNVKGRHYHELQSDLAQDVRKKGPAGGSLEKDKAEYDDLSNKVGQMRANPPKGNPEQVNAELAKLDQRKLILQKRINAAGREAPTYKLEQPFQGFETNPSVEQQLLMKNSIQATMRDGGSFATFPGAESAQAQLYEKKVPINLKQVVKDLGGEKAGFEIRNIQLQDQGGNPVMVHGVTWSPEAATRVLKEGVKFRHGGSVERQSDDNRRYL